MSASISVIVPTLNEAENVRPLIERIVASGASLQEIIFVDDGSRDGTRALLHEIRAPLPLRVIERENPALGLSGAVRAGAEAAAGEFLVILDADLSHPPDKIPELIAPLAGGRADLVIGSRYVRGGSTPGWPIWRKMMSRAAAAISYPLTGVHDSMCGFFAVRRATLLARSSGATGFKIAFEMIVHRGPKLRVLEIPIVFRDRVRGHSKMNFGVASRFAFRWALAVGRLRAARPVTAPPRPQTN